MRFLKKILIALLVAFIIIQLIQPVRNASGLVASTDISKTVSVPENVKHVLKTACYDCHSNNTNYPWYSRVQPFGWMLANHIKHGKKNLNFSEFGKYPPRMQQSKLKAIADQIKDREMPLYSYTLIHKNARLTTEQKNMIIAWAQHNIDSLDKINP